MNKTEENNGVGRGASLYINLGKGDTLAQKSRESPPPHSYRRKRACRDLEGCWKHPDPEFGFGDNFCF
eukprot:1161840-Pelagomonas_calceolata.AAC.20